MLSNLSVGIEIGSASMKIVYGSANSKKIYIKNYDIFDTPDGTFLPNDSLNIQTILPVLKNKVKKLKFKRRGCYIALSSRKAIVRERELPKVKPRDMEELVKYEAEQFLPYSSDEFIIDYKVIGEDKTEDKDLFKVLIVAVPIEIIDSYIELVKKSGLKLKGIDVYTNCIYKYGNRSLLEKDKNTLLVDIGGDTTKMTIFRGLEYFANINSDIGGSTANNAIVQMMGVKKNQAEELKREKGILMSSYMSNVVDSERLTMATYLEDTYSQIGSEIMRVIDFFRTRRYGDQIDNVFFLGGGSNVKGLENYFQDMLGIGVKGIEPLESLNTHKKIELKKEDYKILVPAIGAIMRG
ncbi:MAG: type pilus assembly protein PilM pilN [Candidatus Petromonas sp.]|jgi:type IV pilus assembly protein PilM|nr:type pilus assembly protein PilM pilN [Candidatus Petromonas sp.]